jgi:hypothetical protein
MNEINEYENFFSSDDEDGNQGEEDLFETEDDSKEILIKEEKEEKEEKVKPAKGFKKDGTARAPYVFTDARKKSLERAKEARRNNVTSRAQKKQTISNLVNNGSLVDKNDINTLIQQNKELSERLNMIADNNSKVGSNETEIKKEKQVKAKKTRRKVVVLNLPESETETTQTETGTDTDYSIARLKKPKKIVKKKTVAVSDTSESEFDNYPPSIRPNNRPYHPNNLSTTDLKKLFF